MNKSEAKQLQRALRETVAPTMVVDGDWGPGSQAALKEFAKVSDIDEAAAMDLLHKYADVRYVSDDAFAQAAKALGVPQSYVRSIAATETNGDSFLKDGRVKILFERHWFRRKLSEALLNISVQKTVSTELQLPAIITGAQAPAKLLALVEGKYPDLCNATPGGYKGGEAEWPRLEQAMDLDIESGAQAASYGGYQLMGFNFKACGYSSAKEMMLDLAKSESHQFLAMISFIKSSSSMLSALKAGNWAAFAKLYNGSDYAKNNYDTKLASNEKANQSFNA